MDNISLHAPEILLGGKLWPVPALSAKQNKIIDPLILSLLPVFAQWQTDRAGAITKLGSTEYDALLKIGFVAITRQHPELTQEQFLELPITLLELVSAFGIIAQQTGIFQKENILGEVLGA